MHKYIIMGVQGCGKGTQAKMLKEYLDLVHISVGDIFRWNIQSRTKLGARVKRHHRRRTTGAGRRVVEDVCAAGWMNTTGTTVSSWTASRATGRKPSSFSKATTSTP